MSLVLYETDFLMLDGDGPHTIDLKAPRTMIGRGSQTIHVDAAIFVRNKGADIISRRHAEITRTVEGKYVIQDLGALNGTYVNSKRITCQQLQHGDILQFGGLSNLPAGQDIYCVKYMYQATNESVNFNEDKNENKNKNDNKNENKNAAKTVKSEKSEKSEKKEKSEKSGKKEKSEKMEKSDKSAVKRKKVIRIDDDEEYIDASSTSDGRMKKRSIAEIKRNNLNNINNLNNGQDGNKINIDKNNSYNENENYDKSDKNDKNNKNNSMQMEMDSLRSQIIELKRREIESRAAAHAAVEAANKMKLEGVPQDFPSMPSMPSMPTVPCILLTSSTQFTAATNTYTITPATTVRNSMGISETIATPIPFPALRPSSSSSSSSVPLNSSPPSFSHHPPPSSSLPISSTRPSPLIPLPTTSCGPTFDPLKGCYIDTIRGANDAVGLHFSMPKADMEKHEIKMAKFDSGSAEHSPRSDKECSPNTSFESNSTIGCSIDVSSLRSSLSCAICSLPLLDAVVVPCSHGFCRSCLEVSLSQGNCTCPVCDDAPPKTYSDNSKVYRYCPYVRSDHLDSVVWLLHEASASGEREAFLTREKVARQTLRALNIDPDSAPGENNKKIKNILRKRKREREHLEMPEKESRESHHPDSSNAYDSDGQTIDDNNMCDYDGEESDDDENDDEDCDI